MIYFDTNVLHVIRASTGETGLTEDLRENIVLSPISAIEMLSKFRRDDGEKFFRSTQRLRSWLHSPCTILDWPGGAVAWALGVDRPDQSATSVGDALNACFQATSFEEYMGKFDTQISGLEQSRDAKKQRLATTTQRLVEEIRAGRYHLEDFPSNLLRGLATDLGLSPSAAVFDNALVKLSASFEFIMARLSAGTQDANDWFDAYQLVYLENDDLKFVTCDRGFECIRDSPQKKRINVVAQEIMQDPAKAQDYLEGLN
jgi:hypothetical protein